MSRNMLEAMFDHAIAGDDVFLVFVPGGEPLAAEGTMGVAPSAADDDEKPTLRVVR